MLTNLLTNTSLLYRAGISLFLQSSVNTGIMIWRWNLVQFLYYFSVGNVISQPYWNAYCLNTYVSECVLHDAVHWQDCQECSIQSIFGST